MGISSFIDYIFRQRRREKTPKLFEDIIRCMESETLQVTYGGEPDTYRLQNRMIVVEFQKNENTTETAIFKPFSFPEQVCAAYQDSSILEITIGEAVTPNALDRGEAARANRALVIIHREIEYFLSR